VAETGITAVPATAAAAHIRLMGMACEKTANAVFAMHSVAWLESKELKFDENEKQLAVMMKKLSWKAWK